jgi:streptogramin lyase
MSDFLTELREELLDGLERYERAPRSRRMLGRIARTRVGPAARRVAAVVVAGVAAVAVAVEVADRPPEHEQSTRPQASRLEGFLATGLAPADGLLWVAEEDTGSLLRIDLRTGSIRARIDVGGLPGAAIAGGGAIWILDWQGRLLKIDPRTDRVTDTLELRQTGGDISFAAGSVWAVGDGARLLRVDPESVEVTDQVELGPAYAQPTGHARSQTLAVAGDTLWVVGASGVVTELDARTAEILGRASGPRTQAERTRRVGADDSGVWIASAGRREVMHVDARTRRVTRIPVGGDPGALAVVDGHVWLGTLHDTGTLTRLTVLDSRGRLVRTLPVPNRPIEIAQAPDGGAWVSFGENAIATPAAVRVVAPALGP